MCELPAFVKNYLDEIAINEGFVEHSVEVVNPSTEIGDNFSGFLTSVVIKGRRQVNGIVEEGQLNLVVKIPPLDVRQRTVFYTDFLFKRETFVYNRLLPTFVQFQKERGISEEEGFFSFPKCYKAESNEETDNFVVIMEDLRPKGFNMWPKRQTIPPKHCRLILEQLGRYHGISLALKDQKPEIFEEFKKLNDQFHMFLQDEGMNKILQYSYTRARNAIVNERDREIMADVRDTFVEKGLNSLIPDEFSVVGHGDCWNNNILYQCDETGDVKAVRIVDWQMTRYTSPAIDLLHLIFTSTDKELRDRHYASLLESYYSSLSSIVKKLGSDPKKILTVDDFHNQMKKYGNFGLVMAPIVIQTVLTNPEQLMDWDRFTEDLAKETVDGTTVTTSFDDSTQVIYKKRIADVITDIADLGYYSK